jgi:hypothetical protein
MDKANFSSCGLSENDHAQYSTIGLKGTEIQTNNSEVVDV